MQKAFQKTVATAAHEMMTNGKLSKETESSLKHQSAAAMMAIHKIASMTEPVVNWLESIGASNDHKIDEKPSPSMRSK